MVRNRFCGDPNPCDAWRRGQRLRHLFLCVEGVCAPNGRKKRTQREKPIKKYYFCVSLRIRAPESSNSESRTTGQPDTRCVAVGAVWAMWQRLIGRAYGRGRPSAVNAAPLLPFHVAGADWPTPTTRSGAGRMARDRTFGRCADGAKCLSVGLLFSRARKLVHELSFGQN